MYKNISIILGVALICYSPLHAQNRAIDSLQNLIANAKQDSTKGLLYLKLARASVSELDVYEKYAKKGIELCRKGGHIGGVAKGHLSVGFARQRMGDLDSSFAEFARAEALFRQLGDSSSLSGVYLQLAGNYSFMGELDKAIVYQKRTLAIAKQSGDNSKVGSAYIGIAGSYGRMGDYDKAMSYTLDASRYAEKTTDEELKANVNRNLVNIYSFTGKYEKALEFAEKELAIWRKTGNVAQEQTCLENIGSMHMNLLNFSKALKVYNESLALLDEDLTPDPASTLYTKLGECHRELGDLTKSYQYLQKAEKIINQLGYMEFLGYVNQQLAITQIEREEYASALEYLNKAEETAIEIGDVFGQKEILLAFSDVYAKTGKYQFSLESYKKSTLLKDSLFNMDSETAMASMKTKYDTEKKDLQIDVLQKQAEIDKRKSARQRMLIFGSLLLALLAGAVGYLRIRQNKLNQRLKMERFRNKVAADLHDDVGSTLSSIAMYSEVIKQKAVTKLPEALPMLENMTNSSKELMDAMSDIVWTINPKNNSLHSLLTRIKHLSSEICEAKDVLFQYEQSGDIEGQKMDMEAAQNVFLVLKEGVNNALKYSECTELQMRVAQTKNSLSFELKDNGKGFDTKDESLGNGMRTMRVRMTEIGGTYGVHSSGDGTIISGTLPV